MGEAESLKVDPLLPGHWPARGESGSALRRADAPPPVRAAGGAPRSTDAAQYCQSSVTEFERTVRAVVGRLAPGEVVSYGDVAAETGHPGAARAVGTVLARADESLPWWRVVTATGRLVPGHEQEQARLLAAEGVVIETGRVRFGRPPAGLL